MNLSKMGVESATAYMRRFGVLQWFWLYNTCIKEYKKRGKQREIMHQVIHYFTYILDVK